MDANEIMLKLDGLNQACRQEKHGDCRDLMNAGWYQDDRFIQPIYRSGWSRPNSFAVELTLCISPHIAITQNFPEHRYVGYADLDHSFGSELKHLSDKLEEIEIWMMMERV